jgi:hypothetical protein
MNLDSYKKNSIAAQALNEEIAVVDTDEIISAIIEQKALSSLAYQISEVSPIHGPTGATFALVYQNGKVKLLRGEVVVEMDVVEDTGFTVEAYEDLKTQFGKDVADYVGRAFASVSSVKENLKLMQTLTALSTPFGSLTFTDAGNSESILFETQQKVAEAVIKINDTYFRSLDAFAIVPAKAAAAVLASSNWTMGSKDASGLFLGNSGRTKYYLNPDKTSTKVFVGVKSDLPGNSSMILSPYQHAITTAADFETGETNLFNINRYAITQSKISDIAPMLYSFDIL